MVNQEQVCQWFLDRGWVEYPSNNSRSFEKDCLSGPICQCNDKTPRLHVSVYPPFAILANDEARIEFVVFGEYNEIWLQALIYSVGPRQLESKIEQIITKANAVWQGFCGVS